MSIKATVNPAADTAEITKEELIADAASMKLLCWTAF